MSKPRRKRYSNGGSSDFINVKIDAQRVKRVPRKVAVAYFSGEPLTTADALYWNAFFRSRPELHPDPRVAGQVPQILAAIAAELPNGRQDKPLVFGDYHGTTRAAVDAARAAIRAGGSPEEVRAAVRAAHDAEDAARDG